MELSDFSIRIFKGDETSRLIIFIHDDESLIDKIIPKIEGEKPSIICISGNDWNRDFSPSIASIKLFGKTTNFTGNASQYLLFFKNNIIPHCLEELKIVNLNNYKLCIAGYSLAGLFSIFSVFNSNIFTYCLSCSSSLWFPDFVDNVKSKTVSKKLKNVYFSLGNAEEKSKNQYISSVLIKTKECIDVLKSQGIKCFFEENDGGHFKDVDLRILKAINYIVKIDHLSKSLANPPSF
jgi:predicted alpha/beta superfamily hydrolase